MPRIQLYGDQPKRKARPLLSGCVVHRDRESSLRGAGYTILDIKEQTTLNRDIEIPFLGNPKAKDMAVFCRQFVSILRAGVSVASVLAMLGQQTSNKKLRAAIREMQADVEKGEALASSMRRHPKIFPAILVNMVSAGEASGQSGGILPPDGALFRTQQCAPRAR